MKITVTTTSNKIEDLLPAYRRDEFTGDRTMVLYPKGDIYYSNDLNGDASLTESIPLKADTMYAFVLNDVTIGTFKVIASANTDVLVEIH